MDKWSEYGDIKDGGYIVKWISNTRYLRIVNTGDTFRAEVKETGNNYYDKKTGIDTLEEAKEEVEKMKDNLL